MRYPGSKSEYSYISTVLTKIFTYCQENNYKTIAIPTLGCGTGRLNVGEVIQLIIEKNKPYQFDVIIYSGDPCNIPN